jgi:hypothetical protein
MHRTPRDRSPGGPDEAPEKWIANKGDGVSGFGRRLGELSGRVGAAFQHTTPGDEHPLSLEWERRTASVLPRFPIAKQGYARGAVDEYLEELQSALLQSHYELNELRDQTASPPSITTEIERLGEQTSAILITAHKTATDTVSRAQIDADTRVADATSYAIALREEADLERRRAAAETALLREERARLIDEMQATAAALRTLAADAAARENGAIPARHAPVVIG